MKDVKCTIMVKNDDGTESECGKMMTRNDAAVNNHIRLVHPEISTKKRTKIRMGIFGDQREEHKLRKQHGRTQLEKALLKTTGVS